MEQYSYLRPVYVRAMADEIKRLGGVPFAVDTTTLPYTTFPTRTTAVDYLNTVHRNGYDPGVIGCPIIIADGFLGLDDVHIELPEGVILKEQYVAIVDSALAVTKAVGKENMAFINLAIDMSPWCDCVPFSDRPAGLTMGRFYRKKHWI